MTRNKSTDQFYLVIVDGDENVFNIEGPMTDDESWISQVTQLQEKGRKVRCFSHRGEKDRIANDYSRSSGKKYVLQSILYKPEG